MTPDLQPFVISRTFDAPRDLVWKAHTQCEHLRHWWGPKGFKITDCKIDLRPGGTFLYGMQPVSGGDKIWGKFVYREIDEPEKLVFVVSFSDENAGITRHPMSSVWPLEIFGTSHSAKKMERRRSQSHGNLSTQLRKRSMRSKPVARV